MRPEIKIHQIGPVCKFGPGGDFIRSWPKEYSPENAGPITSVLMRINKLLGTINKQPDALIIAHKGNADVITAQNDRTAHAASNATAKNHNDILGQTLLFTDDNRACQTAQLKPKYNIRASRRAAKKGFACRFPAQRALFETDQSSVKTA